MMAELDILNGFAGKVISDCIDITVDAIKKADKNRKSYNQNIQTRIYQVIIDSLNYFTYNKYKRQDKLYDASENILKGFKSGKNDVYAIETGLKNLVPDVSDNICQYFLETLCREICRDENFDLYKEIDMLWRKQESEYVHREFERSSQNGKEILGKLNDLKEGVDYIKETVNGIEIYQKENSGKILIKNRTEEYAQKWNENVFLNNFNEEDENVGTEIKLWEIYKEECLPHYIWKTNSNPSKKTLRDKLKEYIIDKQSKKMLLILGQAGIGKSTLITWIMANLVEKKEDVFVYQFAADLDRIDWQGNNVLNDIFNAIGLGFDELENKTLILDGFDEIYAGGDRERILNKLNQDLIKCNMLKTFSLLITCRENYIYNLQNIDCDYIVLQAWDEIQIGIFCRAYWEKCGNDIVEDIIQRIMENKAIFGIPLILYMILALNVDIKKGSSKMDIYDQVFSLRKGGIYDRCYDSEHRINSPEIKKHIHRISQRIAFWIFENNADKAYISQDIFKRICVNEMNESGEKSEEIQNDTLIGNFFKVKHCEGKGTDELQFVHRSIYEYFVVIYFFESIHMLTSKEEVAGKLGELLKEGRLSEQILEFIKYKFDSIEGYSLSDVTKEIFNIMLQDGMTYYVKGKYKNIIVREINIFSNMLEIVHLWNPQLGKSDSNICHYLQHNRFNILNLSGADLKETNLFEVDLSGADFKEAVLNGVNFSRAKLSGADFKGANLSGADLRKADLSGADLKEAVLKEAKLSGTDLIGEDLIGVELNEADLRKADLSEAYLSGAGLRRADLRRANLSGADLSGAYLSEADLNGADLRRADLNEADLVGTIFDERQVDILHEKYDLSRSKVILFETDEIISYQEYCIRKQKK